MIKAWFVRVETTHRVFQTIVHLFKQRCYISIFLQTLMKTVTLLPLKDISTAQYGIRVMNLKKLS